MENKLSYGMDLFLVLGALGMLLLLPAEAAAGAQKGLGVCAGVIIPGLLPFLTLSGLLSALGLPVRLAARLEKPLRQIGVSSAAVAPLLLGLTGGYPLGAAILGDMVRSGDLDPREAERLLPACSNTGPAFIVGAAGCAVFGSPASGLLLYASHIIAALVLLLLLGRHGGVPSPAAVPPPRRAASALPDCVRAAAASTVNICAFVVFFSVLTGLLRGAGLFSALSLPLIRRFGAAPQAITALLTGLLELGSGIGAMAGLPVSDRNLALASFLLGFGGLSVHCQTLSVLSGTNVRCARHFVGRILHGGLSAAVTYLLFMLLQI